MGSLLLVRHGQASANAEVYDRLSPLGEAQSRKLGTHWARRAELFDRVYCGPRERQRRSAELAVESYRAGGGRIAAPEVLEELDEMRIEPLLTDQLRALCERHPLLRDVVGEMLSAKTDAERNHLRLKLGGTVMRMWSQNLIGAPGVETWLEFKTRVRAALDHMLRGAPRGARLVAFTSAGVVGASAQLALEIANATALEMALQVRNASKSRFLFSSGETPRFSLSSFNELPHLAEEPAMITSL